MANRSRRISLHVCGHGFGLTVLLLACACATTINFRKSEETMVSPAAGSPFDAAPFGMTTYDPSTGVYEIRWAEPRKIRRVVVTFPADPARSDPQNMRLEYWHCTWNGQADPILAEQGAGAVGWNAMDDWTNGRWRDTHARIHRERTEWVFTFPTTREVDPNVSGDGVAYRKTLKLRLTSDTPSPKPAQLQALTDAVCRPLTVRIQWGAPAHPDIQAVTGPAEGRLEVFNGAVVAVRALPEVRSGFAIQGAAWHGPADQGGIEADLLYAVDPLDDRYDRTVVTVFLAGRPFSFAADEAARGDRILVNDLGVLVTHQKDSISLDGYRDALREFPGRTVYARVFDEPEQSLARAWDEMPLKRPFYFVHGVPGNRNAYHQTPNGDIVIHGGHWFHRLPSERDGARKNWQGGNLTLGFGFPDADLRGGRALHDGYLPLLRTWWQDGPILYDLYTLCDTLDGSFDNIAGDAPTVLLARLALVNTSDRERGTARLKLSSGEDEAVRVDQDLVYGTADGKQRLRYLMRLGSRGTLQPDGPTTRWTLDLAPGERHTIELLIPSVTLDTREEIDALRKRNLDADRERILTWWRQFTDQGTEIITPEPWINDFYKAHARHLLINCVREIGSDRLHAHVGTFGYGVFPDESAMMISDLDRRGYHDLAARCLESFLEYQGTVQMPGNFRTTEGLFYGSGGHETGGYNKSHGWVLWNMADHWWITRDRAWMAHAAPKLIAGCEWVIRERQATMHLDPDGNRPLEYGFLPTGSLEDVTDYWHWLVTNACTVWGFSAVARALEDYGHPDAPRLLQQARAFYDDVMTGLEAARLRTPVVRLRDLTYVPKYPSRLYERGRCHGWLRETLEGSIHLLITRLLDSNTAQGEWILKDFEDNLYISDRYGYAIPVFDRFWFSRGGFSMQANLLGGPLPYLYRDQPKHFLRAYLNGFASAFYPETRMCNEHSLPELGYPVGDHFKSSDEAQSTYWLRLMFVYEEGNSLHLGRALPRAWLADGRQVAIRRAPSTFGPLSLVIDSQAAHGRITARVDLPTRNPPQQALLRLRHPDEKKIARVEIDGRPYAQFDANREWIDLPMDAGTSLEVVAFYP